jgi:hypothetical protein
MMHRRVVPSGKSPIEAATNVSRPLSRRRKMNRRQMLFYQNKREVIILLIQLLSYLILIVCGVTLFSKWVFGYNLLNGEQDSSSPRMHHHHGMWMHDDQVHEPYKSNEERIAHEFPPLFPSKVYQIPDAMPHIGDKTDEYAILRREVDGKVLPEVPQQFSFDPMVMQHTNSDQVSYDIYDCPDTPPTGYPFDWTLLDVLKSWPPDDPTPRPKIFQGLCVFDYNKDYDKAMTYRVAELPFVVINDPQVQQAVKRWNAPEYMASMLGGVQHRTEYSENNHFLYWNAPRTKKKKGVLRPPPQKDELKDWKEPTQMLRMPYLEWLHHANVTDEELGPDKPHWYYRLIGCGETGPNGSCDAGSSEYLFDELPFFQPKPSLYIVRPEKQKGIHCRFGMKGVIAENHFDGSRNSIAVLGGERRYILSHPKQCKNLALLPKGHPSARHSAVDWSDPDLEKYPEFQLARGNEVVLQAGDVLYLPTNWFHFIISLSLNFQCNTRSGLEDTYMVPMHECGF